VLVLKISVGEGVERRKKGREEDPGHWDRLTRGKARPSFTPL